jgi:hypothetical protein
MRSTNIRKAILEILARAQPYALPEAQLKIELDGSVRPPVQQAEFDEALLQLSNRAAIGTVPDPLDEELVKWTIREAGVALLNH